MKTYFLNSVRTKKLIREKGENFTAASKRAGFSPSALNTYLRGGSKISQKNLDKLALHLNIYPSFLIDYNPSNEKLERYKKERLRRASEESTVNAKSNPESKTICSHKSSSNLSSIKKDLILLKLETATLTTQNEALKQMALQILTTCKKTKIIC